MKNVLRIFMTLPLFLCVNCASGADGNATTQTADLPEATEQEQTPPAEVRPADAALIVIDKQSMSIAVYDYRSRLQAAFPVAVGRGIGNKEKPGDMKTPEGVFSIQQIQDAHTWSHDFGDGKGDIKGAYGSHFIRLKTPGHSGIGIHGTHDPASIGTRASEGCIRLRNEDLLQLVKYAYVGMPVIITTSEADQAVPCQMPEAAKKGPALSSNATAAGKPAVQEPKTAEKTAAKPAATNAKTKTHVVASGETLSTIAQKYGMTTARLRELNRSVRNDRIAAGQTLVVESK